MNDWQPIKQAPKDVELVVTDFTSPPEFARWIESRMYIEGGFWQNRDGRRREIPTHFFRLPPGLVVEMKTRLV